MHKNNAHKNNLHQRGAVSIITVIFISILLTIMVTGFLRLAINEQREATDDDLTTRAFYAAESGVQDAITAIKDYVDNDTPINNANICKPAAGDGILSDNPSLDTAYTCQLVEVAPVDYQASLEEGGSTFFKLETSTNNIDTLKLSWHVFGDNEDSDSIDYTRRTSGVSTLIDKVDWNSPGKRYPAMMRVQIVSIPETGAIHRDDIKNKVGFLNPADSGSSTSSLTAAFDGQIIDSSCIDPASSPTAGQYICEAEITDLDDAHYNYFIRISTIYRSTHFKLEAIKDDATVAALEDAQAIIDVTGKAGDVYRRVEKRIALTNDSLWPPYAIFSAQNICKDFSITDDVNEFTALNTSFNAANPTSCY